MVNGLRRIATIQSGWEGIGIDKRRSVVGVLKQDYVVDVAWILAWIVVDCEGLRMTDDEGEWVVGCFVAAVQCRTGGGEE